MIGFFRVLRAKINIFGKIRTDLTVPVFPQRLPDGAIKLSDRHKHIKVPATKAARPSDKSLGRTKAAVG